MLKSRFTKVFAGLAIGCSMLALAGCTSESAISETDEASLEATIADAEAGAMELINAATGENSWTGPTNSPEPNEGLRVTIVPSTMTAKGSSRPAQTMVNASKDLGWETKISDGQGRADVQLQAVQTAVDEGVDAIVLIFVDTHLVQAGVDRAIEAGIPVITLGSLKNTPESVPDVSFDWVRAGEAIGQYMVWKSEGDLSLLQMKNTDLYITVEGQYKGSQEYIEENCPECKTKTVEWTLANFDDPVSGPAAMAASALQADPSINWVSCFDACMFRVSQAVERAGLQDTVSGAGFDCNPENVEIIMSDGVQKVCFADPRDWMALAALDNINRMNNGEDVYDYTPSIPTALFDKDVFDSMSEEERAELEEIGWQGNFDFEAEFRKLWGLPAATAADSWT